MRPRFNALKKREARRLKAFAFPPGPPNPFQRNSPFLPFVILLSSASLPLLFLFLSFLSYFFPFLYLSSFIFPSSFISFLFYFFPLLFLSFLFHFFPLLFLSFLFYFFSFFYFFPSPFISFPFISFLFYFSFMRHSLWGWPHALVGSEVTPPKSTQLPRAGCTLCLWWFRNALGSARKKY